MQYQGGNKKVEQGSLHASKPSAHGFTHYINHESNSKKPPLLQEQKDIINVCINGRFAHLLLTRNGMDFIQYHKAPLLTFKPLHYSFRFPRAFCRVPQHGIRADGNRTANGLVFSIRREATDLAVVNGGPHLELGLPLLHRHGGIPEHQAPLAHGARSRHSHQRLASTCRAGGVTLISHLSDTTGAGGKQKSKGKP